MSKNEAALKLARSIAPIEWCKNQIVLDAMVAAILEVTERAAGLADRKVKRPGGSHDHTVATALRNLEHLS